MTEREQEFTPGLVTLFCDVSYCPNSKAAGFGAWYRTDDMEKGEFFGDGVPVACKSSNDSEFWGAVLAIRHVLKTIGTKVKTIVLQCDNINALSWIREFHPNAAAVGDHHGTHGIPLPSKTYPKSMETAVAVIRAMDPSVKVWLKHVKGHDHKSKSARSWVNQRCDDLAREHMTAKRNRIGRR
jgi:ribonuclease HI